LNQQREAFHHSYEGAKAGLEAYRHLVNELKARNELLSRIGCRIQDVYGGITMVVGQAQRIVLTVQYQAPHVNSLENTVLVAQFYDGVPRLPNLMSFEDPRTLKTWKFTFGLLRPDRPGWVGPDGKEHLPEALAEFLLKQFMELQQRQLG
jgi:hypothetical protein